MTDMEDFFAGPVDPRVTRVMHAVLIIPVILMLIVIIYAFVENNNAWNQKRAPFRVTPAMTNTSYDNSSWLHGRP